MTMLSHAFIYMFYWPAYVKEIKDTVYEIK